MTLLLDTHALLWWLSDDERLGIVTRRLVADPGNEVLVSAASLWEIVLKHRSGKLACDIMAIESSFAHEGFRRLEISPAHLFTLDKLALHHNDLFDHLLIAQAIAEDAVLISDNRHMPLYPIQLQRCSV